jgi:hypothetical protein
MAKGPTVKAWPWLYPLLAFLNCQAPSVATEVDGVWVSTCGAGWSVGIRWSSQGGDSVLWYYFALLFFLLSSYSVFQYVEATNKFLELLRDIVMLGEYLFDIIVQALNESGMFCSIIQLNIIRVELEFCIIGEKSRFVCLTAGGFHSAIAM